MIDTTGQDLLDKFYAARKELKKARTPSEKIALVNYIGNLYMSILCMGIPIEYDRKRFFGDKKTYNKAIKKINIYSDKQLMNFVLNKEFHHQYFGEVIPTVEDELINLCELDIPEEDDINESEFLDILNEFMKSINLQELFDDYYKKDKIHSTITSDSNGNLGFTLFNPVDKDTDLFVREFEGDFLSLQTLVHEFGHGYDLSKFQDIEKYNEYFYLSFYGETIPRLFERLLFRFLLKNRVKENLTKDRFVDFVDLNHDFLLQAYLLSVLDEEFLLQGDIADCTAEELGNRVKAHFLDEKSLIDFIERVQDFDLSDVYNYAYGDIVSLFLCEEVEKYGFSSELMEYFNSERHKVFNPELLRECGFGPDNYKELFKKEIQLVKK